MLKKLLLCTILSCATLPTQAMVASQEPPSELDQTLHEIEMTDASLLRYLDFSSKIDYIENTLIPFLSSQNLPDIEKIVKQFTPEFKAHLVNVDIFADFIVTLNRLLPAKNLRFGTARVILEGYINDLGIIDELKKKKTVAEIKIQALVLAEAVLLEVANIENRNEVNDIVKDNITFWYDFLRKIHPILRGTMGVYQITEQIKQIEHHFYQFLKDRKLDRLKTILELNKNMLASISEF